ncbi:hypothetical protein JCM8547_002757 [Rhodosporidiobolus lusitaniae]
MSANTTLVACWVCGSPSTTRCSGCAKSKPPFEVLCCSQACQQMVWPVHKIFCGPNKANPLVLAPLSKKEADEAKQHMHDTYRLRMRDESSSLAIRLGRYGFSEMGMQVWPIHKLFCGPGKTNPFIFPPLSKEEADEALANSGSTYIWPGVHATSLNEWLRRLGCTEAACILATIRYSRDLRAFRTRKITGELPPSRLFVLCRCSQIAVVNLSNFWRGKADHAATPSWVFPFLHHLSFFEFLACDQIQAYDPKRRTALRHMRFSIVKVVHKVVKRTHPTEAAKLWDMLQPVLRLAHQSEILTSSWS